MAFFYADRCVANWLAIEEFFNQLLRNIRSKLYVSAETSHRHQDLQDMVGRD
jgi:hypothetical protein